MKRREMLRGSAALLGAGPFSGAGPFLAAGVFSGAGPFLAAPARGGARRLRFGLTPVFLSNDIALLTALRRYLEKATGYGVDLVRRRTYQEITTLLVAGQLDGAWICGYPFVRFESALELLAVPLWNGRPRYQAYLIGARGRDASVIDDLKGDLHCFSDPNSNSGYLVTNALLADRKTRPDRFFKKAFFAYGHRNVVRAVAAGLAQSGSVDGYVWEVLNKAEPALTEKTEIVWKSPWYGFPPVAAPKAAAGTARFRALQAALFDMNKDALGWEVLDLLQLDGFAPTRAAAFASIAALSRKVQDMG